MFKKTCVICSTQKNRRAGRFLIYHISPRGKSIPKCWVCFECLDRNGPDFCKETFNMLNIAGANP